MDNETKLQYKVQALLERVSGITSEHENRAADLRVEVTELNQENLALKERIEELTLMVENTSEGTENNEVIPQNPAE